MIHVYLMPGMSANSLIFERIKLPKDYRSHLLDWIDPKKDESISDYAIRFSKLIEHENPVLLGVSFGGILVQEISKIIKVKLLIIISSVKCKSELPPHMKFGRITKTYKLLPIRWINDFESLALFVLGPIVEKRLKLYRKYLTVRDENYLSWSIRELVQWKQSKPLNNVVHIHGTNDKIFPVSNIKNFIELPMGDHAMILKRSDWLNKELPKLIEKIKFFSFVAALF